MAFIRIIKLNKKSIYLPIIAAVLLSPLPSYAGFQFKKQEYPSKQEVTPAFPDLKKQILSEDKTVENKSAESVSKQPPPAPKQEATPVIAPAKPDPVARAAEIETDILAGFANDLPLVVALQQIAPAGYQFSFARGVNPGINVSWQGGKKWEQVLSTMLAQHNLSYRVRNNILVVHQMYDEQPAAKEMQAVAASEIKPSDVKALPPIQQASPSFNDRTAKPVSIQNQLIAQDIVWHNAMPQQGSRTIVQAEPLTPMPPAFSSANHLTAKGISQVPLPSPLPGQMAPLSITPPQKVEQTYKVLQRPPLPDSVSKRLPLPDEINSQKVAQNTAPAVNVPQRPPLPSSLLFPVKEKSKSPDSFAAAPQMLVSGRVNSKLGGEAIPRLDDIAPEMVKPLWIAKRNQTLREVLTEWSKREGIELYWSIDYDYKLNKDVGYNGDFEYAVAELLDVFKTIRPQPYGQLHKGSVNPLVLVINSYDLSH